MIKKGQLSPWLVTKPGRRERGLDWDRGGGIITHMFVPGHVRLA